MYTDPLAFLFFFLRMQTQNYVSETSRSDQEKLCRERIATGVSIKQLVSNNHVAGMIAFAMKGETHKEDTLDSVANYSVTVFPP